MQSAKLSKEVMPENYNLLIEPSHDNLTFKGKVEIKINIRNPVNTVTLHSSELKINKVNLKSDSQNTAKVETNDTEETLKLTFKNNISKTQTLIIDFSGTISDKLKGFYKAKYFDKIDKIFLTTQFEAPYARRAFPCFDEPSKKATFDFSVKINPNLTAVSNMPILKEEKTSSYKIITFQQSPIMSTYLLYFAIGEFEFLEDTYKKIKLRIVTTPGKSKDGKFALDLTKKFLKYFEEYSNIPYPLPKLDLIAVPDFEAGAMENWGAITFREILLLQNEKTSTAVKKRIAEVIAHELWHQWSGNLVTMDWWEDLWLNESFATYMAFKAMNHYFPEWNSLEDFVIEETAGAFSKDSLKTTHSIAVKVNNPNEISEIFDAISYGKGGSVLRMIESFLGEEAFKKGVQKYLLKYKYKNAIASDLWDNLADFSKSPIKDVMIDWLTKPGYPLIEVSKKDTSINLKQKKFNSKENEKVTWKIPLTLENKKGTIKELFETESKSIKIDSNWIKTNLGQNGFYRTKYDQQLLKELSPLVLNKKISAIDRYGIQNDLFYLCLFGELSLDTYLDFISCYKNENNYTVLLDLCSNLREIYNAFSQENISKENWKKFKNISILPFKNKIKLLGFHPKPNEPQQDTLTRSISINYLQFAEDKEALAFCSQQFNNFIKDSSSVHPDIKGPIIAASAENGNKETYTQLLESYKKTSNVEEKVKVLASLFRFKDENILKSALDFSLTKEVRIQDLRTVFSMVESNSSARKFFFIWIKNNWNNLKNLEKSPYIFMGLIKAIIELSKKEERQQVKQFLTKEKVQYESTKLNAFETVDIYDNWISKNKDILKSYLDKLD